MLPIITSFVIITLVNVLAYIWAYKKQSDHLTDISYSLCFIAVTLYFLLFNGDLTLNRVILASMVVLWAVRLGGFLFYRIHKMGRDTRFDAFRGDAKGFLKFWLLQSLSIAIIILPVLFGLQDVNLVINYFAIVLWCKGWLLQSIADWQKFTFKNTNAKGLFINTGLYTYIRHPNYLGEIMIWLAIFWYVCTTLSHWEWIAILSPIWIITLLIFISGIPLIEKTNIEKRSNDIGYQNYIKRTWRLVPFLY